MNFILNVSSLTGRYVAPEVLKNEEYDTMVDVFSFALILQEVQACHLKKKKISLFFFCWVTFL